jgi:hypothetical protein
MIGKASARPQALRHADPRPQARGQIPGKPGKMLQGYLFEDGALDGHVHHTFSPAAGRAPWHA